VRILVVEDESAIRHLIDRLLTPRGHHVLTAEAPAHAAALLLDFPDPLDLALLDISLPGMSGIEYSAHLRSQFPALRLVFITGWPDEIPEATIYGTVLRKPFMPIDLVTTVERHAA
jgi:CheY-like chemotaxis protein